MDEEVDRRGSAGGAPPLLRVAEAASVANRLHRGRGWPAGWNRPAALHGGTGWLSASLGGGSPRLWVAGRGASPADEGTGRGSGAGLCPSRRKSRIGGPWRVGMGGGCWFLARGCSRPHVALLGPATGAE